MKRYRKALVALALAGLTLATTFAAEPASDPSYTFEAQAGEITGPQELPAGIHAEVSRHRKEQAPRA